LYCRLELERELQEYETEQQINAQYVEEFAMLTSEKVSFDSTYCVACIDGSFGGMSVAKYSLNHGKNSIDGVINCRPDSIGRF